jgi:hypothetical protein
MISYIVYGCQDIYKPTKADGHVFRVTLTTAVEDSELIRPQTSVQNAVEAISSGVL